VPSPSEVTPHVEVHEGNGPPLLLIHGIMAGRALWAANLGPLREVATPVVLELFGHGRSPVPLDQERYEVDAYVDALDEIRASLGVDRWMLFGHSLGAALTMRYALRHPQRVIAHGLSNSATALADDRWRAQIRSSVDEQARAMECATPDELRRSRINPINSRHIVPLVREELVADSALLSPLGVAHHFRSVARAESLRPRITSNQVPCLLVAGRHESAFVEPTSFAEERMPHLAVVRLDAGHSPNAEVPDAFNDVLASFVRSHS
jgi:pimeloyl-ACP methyl ester carboxylesterase